MTEKISCTLLIDDNENTNFLHQMLLKEMGLADEILVALDGKEALDIIRECESLKKGCPELIFLDVNMPVMDGYEFIMAFEKLDINCLPLIVLTQTVPLNSEDLKKWKKTAVKAFLERPLTEEKIIQVLKKNFSRQPNH